MANLNFNLVARWLFPHFIARLLPLSSGFGKVNFPRHKKKKRGRFWGASLHSSTYPLCWSVDSSQWPSTLRSSPLNLWTLTISLFKFKTMSTIFHSRGSTTLPTGLHSPPLSPHLQLYSCPAGHTMPGKIKCNLLPFISYGPHPTLYDIIHCQVSDSLFTPQ